MAGQAGETLRYFVRSAADGRELERGPDPGSLVAELGAAYLHRADLHEAVTRERPGRHRARSPFRVLKDDGGMVTVPWGNTEVPPAKG